MPERGRGTARTGANDGLGVGTVLAGRGVGAGAGGTLIVAEGRNFSGLGGGFRRDGRDAGRGDSLTGTAGRDDAGRGAKPTMLDFRTVLGAGVLASAVEGTFADLGASSQPASRSSAGIPAFRVPTREPSAPKAILFRYPMLPMTSQQRPYVFIMGVAADFYEPLRECAGTGDARVAIRYGRLFGVENET